MTGSTETYYELDDPAYAYWVGDVEPVVVTADLKTGILTSAQLDGRWSGVSQVLGRPGICLGGKLQCFYEIKLVLFDL